MNTLPAPWAHPGRLTATALLLAASLPAWAAGKPFAPGPFDSIEISGSAEVRFIQGAADEVRVEGDEDGRSAEALKVRNGTLQIQPGGAWKFWSSRRLQVEVTARELRRVTISGAADLSAPGPVNVQRLSIEISGAGSARLDQLKAERLDFHVSGAGDGRLAGSARELNVEISGKSRLQAAELMSERARVAISGVADAQVWAVKDLSVAVSGLGTVDYWGQPTVRRSVSGSASLNDRGAKRPAQ